MGNASATGSALHTYADTWSHEGFTAWDNKTINNRNGSIPIYVGHGNAGHAPDEPFNDVDKALEASQSIFNLIPFQSVAHKPIFADYENELRKQFSVRGSENDRINAAKEMIK